MRRAIRGKFAAASAIACNSGFPWRHASQKSNGSRLRAAALSHILAKFPAILRPIAMLAMILAWPIASLREAISCKAAAGGNHRQSSAVAIWKASLRHSIAPAEFLAYGGMEHRDRFLYSGECPWLIGSLTSRDTIRLCNDKGAFSGFCAKNQLPAIQTLAISSKSGLRVLENADLPEPQGLVLKPQFGANGSGIERWRKSGAGYCDGARDLTLAALLDHLARLGQGKDYIVQPEVRPHPSLSAISHGGVPVVRIVTVRAPGGMPVTAGAILQAPLPGAFISQSGMFRLVDVADGAVMPATPAQHDPVFEGLGDDPAFDAVSLNQWNEAKAAVERAHFLLPEPAPVIGWDVIFGETGPVICEANVAISFYFQQAATRMPMDDSIVGETLLAWLKWSN